MNEAERGQRIAARKEKLLSGLETHIASLEELSTTTNFDFDVATDIHPHLLEDTPAGKKQLETWQKLYGELSEGPKTLVTMRWNDGLARGCYGFGQEAKYETRNLWLRVYENVTADNLKFLKRSGGGPSRVVIDHPHDVLVWDTNGLHTSTASKEDWATLYQEEVPSDSMMGDLLSRQTEQQAASEVFSYGDTLHRAINGLERSVDDKLSLNARMGLSNFLFSDSMLRRRSGKS